MMRKGLDNMNMAFVAKTNGIRRWFKYRRLRAQVRSEQYDLQRNMSKYPKCDTAFEIVKEQARSKKYIESKISNSLDHILTRVQNSNNIVRK